MSSLRKHSPSSNEPPRWAERLLHWRCPEDQLEEVQGDLQELFEGWVVELGPAKARRLYGLHVLGFLRPVPWRKEAAAPKTYYHPKHDQPTNAFPMLRNYLKIALRNLVRHKVSSGINMGGLAVGMTVAMLIGLWLEDELSYNQSHQQYDRIAQVMQNQTFDGEIRTWWSQAMQLGPELRTTYGSHFKHVVIASWTGDHLLTVGEKNLTKSGNFMEPGVADMLTLRMLKGSRAGLTEPHSILLSQSVAKAYFGEADPMGQVMKIDNKLDVKVTGVYEDLPANSDFANLTFIAPWELMVKSEGLEKRVGWGNSWFQTLVQIADNADMAKVSAAIKDAKFNKVAQEDDARFKPEIFLHPMSRWHLYADFKNGVNTGGRIDFVWLFGIVGVFVLLLACINFMNLSTARSEKRAKEVGIRKAVGSVRGQLIAQFLGESLVVSAGAFVLSLILVWLLLPSFNQLADKKMVVSWTGPLFWIVGIGFSLLTGVIAGSYPAFYLSSFNAIKALKGTFRVGRLANIPRQILVVVQFTVSITLIIGTMIVFRQIQFAKDRPIGYNRAGLITLPMKTEEVRQYYPVFRNELLKTGAVVEMAQSESPVTNAWITNSGFVWKGKVPGMQDEVVTVGITHEFGKTVDWRIKEGRDFLNTFATDSTGFILNEAAVKYMGFKNPVGENIQAFGRTYTVIGVVKDMVMQSIYEPVRPTLFYIDTYHRVSVISVKINPQASMKEALGKIETVFKKVHPATPFEYRFADVDFEAKYKAEERIGQLAAIFAALAIFISCLGLFGLASFMAEQRTKEIGIRKVMGATMFNLWSLLSKDFVRLVIIALMIAVPTAWYWMNQWLQNYTYRTQLSWWIFGAAGVGALIITLATVSFQAIRVALANPVKSLRTE